MFFLLKDNTTSCIYGEKIESVIKLLEQSANLLLNWFKNNQMKDNEVKCHILFSADKTTQVNKVTVRVNSE